MDLRPYVEAITRQLLLAADAGGGEPRALAERLVAPLEAAIRLALQDVLAVAAEEITCELAPGSVELRLRGRDPEFVVTPALAARPAADLAEDGGDRTSPVSVASPVTSEGDEGGMSRINLRMPDQLKARIEHAAGRDGLSVNAWVVRVSAAAVERGETVHRSEPRGARSSDRYQGWAR
ncbi:MAG: toxin-antitoxin system HicB family antitoxin [Candidatus Dormibacteria bacterium]